ncbi:TetR family transcriptional regulator [Rhodococcus opacus]|uniref:TetR family transcriptional regulator n=1 Tax=Rhodococcus opacus TaxID=37919 RepID=UPI00314545B1
MPRLSADARQHKVLEAALSVAEDRGIGDVSLRAVAKAAGVSGCCATDSPTRTSSSRRSPMP